MNILVYSGNGTATGAVHHAHTTLKSLFCHSYDVIKVDAKVLQTEPWEENCAMIVFPGGRDLPYCKDLNGKPNDRIQRFVQGGGRYLGFCAGAYYASKCIEFEKDNPAMAVVGPRELSFYPGMSCGTMFPGFVYNSEKGARAVSIHVENGSHDMKMYYNGGGYFCDAKNLPVKVLAYYNEHGICKEQKAVAAVQCHVGQGMAILIAVHPEYDTTHMDLSEAENGEQMKKELQQSVQARLDFLSASLADIGMRPNTLDTTGAPNPTPLYLSGLSAEKIKPAIVNLQALAGDSDSHLHKDTTNWFHITSITNNHLPLVDKLELLSMNDENGEDDDEKPVLLNVFYPQMCDVEGPVLPPRSLTPTFDLAAYYRALSTNRQKERGQGRWYQFGSTMLHADVTTSTQTILDRNYKFCQALPDGLVCLATNQITGRGRGRNSWVSQSGALQFSFVLRHDASLSRSPPVFFQYLIALAVVESIRSRKSYENVPLRLKWPNDIYADVPEGLQKVGGLLVNSSYSNGEFLIVIGCGINLCNARPTVSINEVVKQTDSSLAPLSKEDMLASFLVTFERYYAQFCSEGIGSWFLDKYYKRWLHSDKLVTLTTHDNVNARIVGITQDHGMLEVVAVDDPRKRFTLQPDGNSFDMLKGLIKKKE